MTTAETAQTHPSQVEEVGEKPFGPAAAIILAAGIGAFVLGLLTTLAEAEEGFKDWLTFNLRVGALSGKTVLAVSAFFASWALLSWFLLGKNPPWKTVLWIAGVLIGLGLLMTFPTFFQAFAPE